MPLQHYLPATYLAFFSYDNSGARRERRLFVGDRHSNKIFVEKTGNICGIHDLYKTTLMDELDIDKSWSYYEAELDFAIELLLNQNIGALAWAKVLVPFVAGLLIRGPDFSYRLQSRFQDLGEISRRADPNIGRMFELQRLLSIIATSKWIVADPSSSNELITNDLGYIPFGNPRNYEAGMAIPMGKKIILMIVPQLFRRIAYYSQGEWKPHIEYVKLDIGDSNSFNHMMGIYSQRFIFGSNEKIILENLRGSKEIVSPMEPAELGFPVEYGMNHEMTWYKMIKFFSNSKPEEYTQAYLDLRTIPKGGHMIILPLIFSPIY